MKISLSNLHWISREDISQLEEMLLGFSKAGLLNVKSVYGEQFTREDMICACSICYDDGDMSEQTKRNEYWQGMEHNFSVFPKDTIFTLC